MKSLLFLFLLATMYGTIHGQQQQEPKCPVTLEDPTCTYSELIDGFRSVVGKVLGKVNNVSSPSCPDLENCVDILNQNIDSMTNITNAKEALAHILTGYVNATIGCNAKKSLKIFAILCGLDPENVTSMTFNCLNNSTFNYTNGIKSVPAGCLINGLACSESDVKDAFSCVDNMSQCLVDIEYALVGRDDTGILERKSIFTKIVDALKKVALKLVKDLSRG